MPRRPWAPLRTSDPLLIAASWFWSGLAPKAPGTWGSLAALPFAWGLAALGGAPLLLVAAAVVFLLGWRVSEKCLERLADPQADPGWIVIDEAAGVFTTFGLAMLVVPMTFAGWVAGFILFRLFDVWKPGPVGWTDRRLKGGLGIMADDMVAAVPAAVLLIGLMLGLERL